MDLKVMIKNSNYLLISGGLKLREALSGGNFRFKKEAINMESSGPMREYTEAEIKDENKRIRHLRRLVDFSLALIAQSPMSPDEAQRIVQAVRQQAMRLFPGKEETFELLYTPRFRRLIAEKFSLL
jgi:hypothetical protein